jgi:hypothetical protein
MKWWRDIIGKSKIDLTWAECVLLPFVYSILKIYIIGHVLGLKQQWNFNNERFF